RSGAGHRRNRHRLHHDVRRAGDRHVVTSGISAHSATCSMRGTDGHILSALGNRMLRRHAKHMRTALNSMAQGLCMFDAAERLVVCNTRYYEMYGLIESDVPPGVTLSQVLARRVAKGTFSRDPEKYRQEFLDEVRKGRTI